MVFVSNTYYAMYVVTHTQNKFRPPCGKLDNANVRNNELHPLLLKYFIYNAYSYIYERVYLITYKRLPCTNSQIDYAMLFSQTSTSYSILCTLYCLRKQIHTQHCIKHSTIYKPVVLLMKKTEDNITFGMYILLFVTFCA